MPDVSDRCQHELCCLQESNSASIRLYLCSHHCGKMLCLKHLFEHDEYIEKQIQHQDKLKVLRNSCFQIFNDVIRTEMKSLNEKIQYHHKLIEYIDSLLSINYLDESMNKNEKLQAAIKVVQKVIAQENRSRSIAYATSDGGQNNNTNVSTTDNGVGSEVANNNETGARPFEMKNQMRKMTTTDLLTSEILVFSSDSLNGKDPTISSESSWNSDYDAGAVGDNKHGGAILSSSSKNLCTGSQCDQTKSVCKQPSEMKATGLRYQRSLTNQEYLFKGFPTIRHCVCSVDVIDELPILNVEYLLVNDIEVDFIFYSLFLTLGFINSSSECDINSLEIQIFSYGLNMTECIKTTEFDLPILMSKTIKPKIDLSETYDRCLLRQDRSTTNNELRLNYSNEVPNTNSYYRRNTIELHLDYLSSIIFQINDIQNDEVTVKSMEPSLIIIKQNTFPSDLHQLIADIRTQLPTHIHYETTTSVSILVNLFTAVRS
ncbi:unnamed protein product [Adineta steineri]|uniref:Uncharacterized protein n=1 Tax=Adineta steineri TaxID=433720 RepID=A0A816B1S3_9BILA|nr:unnamed protein product [Adineta steineri]CAF1604506.1 unnamed protein product [Adineta steineri]